MNRFVAFVAFTVVLGMFMVVFSGCSQSRTATLDDLTPSKVQPSGVLDLKNGEFTPGPNWEGPVPEMPTLPADESGGLKKFPELARVYWTTATATEMLDVLHELQEMPDGDRKDALLAEWDRLSEEDRKEALAMPPIDKQVEIAGHSIDIRGKTGYFAGTNVRAMWIEIGDDPKDWALGTTGEDRDGIRWEYDPANDRWHEAEQE